MKRLIYKSIVAFVIIGLISFLIIETLIIAHGRNMSIEKVDYIIILGARLYGDIPSPSLLERLIVSRDYLLENDEVMVVVSGGQGIDEYIPEAQAMAKYLIDNDINEDRIIIEDKSTTTFENLQFSLQKIKERNEVDNFKVLLATNRYHIFRAKFLSKRLGMKAYGLPAKIPPTTIIHSYIREYFAVIKSSIFDR